MPPNSPLNAMRKVPAMMNDAQFKWCDPQIQSHFDFPVQLSPRQRQVLLMLCEGLPNKLVGRRLGISGRRLRASGRRLGVSGRLLGVSGRRRGVSGRTARRNGPERSFCEGRNPPPSR